MDKMDKYAGNVCMPSLIWFVLPMIWFFDKIFHRLTFSSFVVYYSKLDKSYLLTNVYIPIDPKTPVKVYDIHIISESFLVHFQLILTPDGQTLF